jgi:hypothetical protein
MSLERSHAEPSPVESWTTTRVPWLALALERRTIGLRTPVVATPPDPPLARGGAETAAQGGGAETAAQGGGAQTTAHTATLPAPAPCAALPPLPSFPLPTSRIVPKSLWGMRLRRNIDGH